MYKLFRKFVSFSKAQLLTALEKKQATDNISAVSVLTNANQIVDFGKYVYMGFDGVFNDIIPNNSLITNEVRIVNLRTTSLTLKDESNTNSLTINPLSYAEFYMQDDGGGVFSFVVGVNTNILEGNSLVTVFDLAVTGVLDIIGYQETVTDIANSGTSKTLSLTGVGTHQVVTMTGNCVFTMPAHITGKSQSFTLDVLTGVGGFTGTFTGVNWSNSIAPTLTTTAGKKDKFMFQSNGASWDGSYIQNFPI